MYSTQHENSSEGPIEWPLIHEPGRHAQSRYNYQQYPIFFTVLFSLLFSKIKQKEKIPTMIIIINECVNRDEQVLDQTSTSCELKIEGS